MTLITCLIAIAAGKFAVFDEGKLPARPIRFKLLFLSGGAMAMIIVGGNAVTGPVLGTGIVTIMNLFGMMGAGLAADAVGFMGTEKKPVTLQKVAGMVLMLAGTALISFL